MKRLLPLLLLMLFLARPADAQVGPTTAPATRLAPAAVAVRSTLGRITPATGPVAVPYTLAGTNHLVVRLKINGHGPYNFVVDTGAPTLLVDETIAQQIGLRPTARRARGRPATRPATRPTQGWATIDRLDIEGGLSMARVRCLVLTPYQITGMNAVGVAGMDLHGLMGYSVLARFKMEIDLARHRMLWTPQPADYVPPPIRSAGPEVASDAREDRLESLGDVMGILGPLVKLEMPGPPVPRGFLGIEFARVGGGDGPARVDVGNVLTESPAYRAGVRAGDAILSVDGRNVATGDDVERAVARLLPGQTVRLVVVRHGPTTREIRVTAGEGL